MILLPGSLPIDARHSLIGQKMIAIKVRELFALSIIFVAVLSAPAMCQQQDNEEE
jgi:hypothetical protein